MGGAGAGCEQKIAASLQYSLRKCVTAPHPRNAALSWLREERVCPTSIGRKGRNRSPWVASKRLAALRSQSCFSAPSCFRWLACDLVTGELHGLVRDRQRSREFVAFLKEVEKACQGAGL